MRDPGRRQERLQCLSFSAKTLTCLAAQVARVAHYTLALTLMQMHSYRNIDITLYLRCDATVLWYLHLLASSTSSPDYNIFARAATFPAQKHSPGNVTSANIAMPP